MRWLNCCDGHFENQLSNCDEATQVLLSLIKDYFIFCGIFFLTFSLRSCWVIWTVTSNMTNFCEDEITLTYKTWRSSTFDYNFYFLKFLIRIDFYLRSSQICDDYFGNKSSSCTEEIRSIQEIWSFFVPWLIAIFCLLEFLYSFINRELYD